MIDKLTFEYSVLDEDGYTDKDVVSKLNEVIDVLNDILKRIEETEE